MPAFKPRADDAASVKESRLSRTAKLDRFMPALKGACPYHFVADGWLVPDRYPKCDRSGALHNDKECRLFRQSFQFERFSYCFSCGLPQDRGHNGEGPLCHSNHTFQKSAQCPFSHFIFKVSVEDGAGPPRPWTPLDHGGVLQLGDEGGARSVPQLFGSFLVVLRREGEGEQTAIYVGTA